MNRLLVAQCLALMVTTLGIALLSVPAALIAFGVCVIVACERQNVDEPEGGDVQ